MALFKIWFLIIIMVCFLFFFENFELFLTNFLVFFYNFFDSVKTLSCDSSGMCNFFLTWFTTLIVSLLFFNVFGLIPFSFTVSTHLIISFSFSFFFFIWINLIYFFRFFLEWGTLFLPSGTPNVILPIIVPIEILSYFSRILSLSIRLFANMMSGHTLLVILSGFLFYGFSFNFLIALPVLILHLIFLMEIGVAFLQVYVFAVLSTLYLQDTISLESH